MACKNECAVCRRASAKKHKFDIVWKVVAIVSTIIAIVFIVLYFVEGALMTTTEIESEIVIENEGDGDPVNTNIGNIGNDYGGGFGYKDIIIILAIILAAGGVAYGSYVSAKSHHTAEGHYPKQESRADGKAENDDTY